MQVRKLEKEKKKRYQRHTHVDVVTVNCYKAYPSPKAMWKWAGVFCEKKRKKKSSKGATTTAKCVSCRAGEEKDG